MTALNVWGTRRVDAAGVALVVLGPVPTWAQWQITNIAVSLTAGSGEARIYATPEPNDASLLAGTYAAELDNAPCNPPLVLDTGEALSVRFTDCTPGETATVVLRGELVSTGNAIR